MRHKWITHYNRNPNTPLATGAVLREERRNWPQVAVGAVPDRADGRWCGFQEEMDKALAAMRIDDVRVKQLQHANNGLLEKRKNRLQAN